MEEVEETMEVWAAFAAAETVENEDAERASLGGSNMLAVSDMAENSVGHSPQSELTEEGGSGTVWREKSSIASGSMGGMKDSKRFSARSRFASAKSSSDFGGTDFPSLQAPQSHFVRTDSGGLLNKCAQDFLLSMRSG